MALFDPVTEALADLDDGQVFALRTILAAHFPATNSPRPHLLIARDHDSLLISLRIPGRAVPHLAFRLPPARAAGTPNYETIDPAIVWQAFEPDP